MLHLKVKHFIFLRTETQVETDTYDEILLFLETHFDEKVYVVHVYVYVSERFTFCFCLQKLGESFDNFVVVLRGLTLMSELGAILEFFLRDLFIRGAKEYPTTHYKKSLY